MDRLLCHFDDRREDVLENQILATALTICAPRVRHAGVAFRARRLGAIFREACEASLPDAQILSEEVSYNRLNQHYEPAHDLARLVAGRAGVSDLFAAGSPSCFAFLLDMNLLFERFVGLVVRRILRGSSLRVRYQHADRSILWDADAGRSYGRVIPDMLVEERGGTAQLAIDAKYKSYDSRRLDSTDIYQAFLYAYAFRSAGHPPRALLLYPSTETAGSGVHLRVRTGRSREEADILVYGLHIPSLLTELDCAELGPACNTIGNCIRERCGSAFGPHEQDGVRALDRTALSFESSHV
jgi:5-methylcytosine-specific restriction enzyme subunit McrC